MISISGAYSGSSIDILDQMAVKTIEDEIKNISEIESISTIISPGKFNIIIELIKGSDKYKCANSITDSINLVKQYLPSDMNEPIVKVLDVKRDLLDITLFSNKVPLSSLQDRAKNLKDQLLNIKNISEVTIRGGSDKYYDIQIQEEKIKTLGINKKTIFNSISQLSYIFPIGKLEDNKEGYYFLSTQNGKQDIDNFLNTRLRVDNKIILLKDITTVSKRYYDASTLYMLDGIPALNIVIKQSNQGNALELSEKINKLIDSIKDSQVQYTVHNDNSQKIKDRLNIVVSNILLGIILITILVVFLINSRMGTIILLGIPTSFVMGVIVLYFFGYTINMISLVGVLIAIGIIVDDAIVVSEHIQQYIENGIPPKEAALKGATEMAKPVILASITTLFSFIPALMISGTMGEVIKLIPIAVSVLVVASLIEAFIFLPIHGYHLLTPKAKTLSWDRANYQYSIILHKLLDSKKSFLFAFIIIIPTLMIAGIALSKFQMFPRFDATTVKIALKANVNTKTEQMLEILEVIQHDIATKKEEFYIEHISSTAGWRMDSASNIESFPYVGNINIELKKLKAQNFVDIFITPYLSFYYDSKGRVRDEKSNIIAKKLDNFLKLQNYKEKFKLQDISVVQKKVGPIKSDIKIGLISNDNQKIIDSIKLLTNKLQAIEGINTISNSARFGIDEIKLKINNYGESLGLNEQSIGSLLSNIYLSKKKAVSFDENDMLEIHLKGSKVDSLKVLENFEIELNNGKKVFLKDVVEFEIVKSFEKVVKDSGIKNFYIYANVDPTIITATEVLKTLESTLQKVRKSGVELKFKGEDEKKKELANDLKAASLLALILIMLAMLYLFNSYRDTIMTMSVIPLSFFGVILGHLLLGVNFSMPTFVGSLGLAGVVINDGIIMMTFLKKAQTTEDVYKMASKRLRPILLTSITTLIGLSTLIFFPTGQAIIFQPLAIALGFGLAWGTILNLLYLPVLYALIYQKKLTLSKT
jgi:multidrug efflux pump subunit AcrB